jgi:co-chaperonin GroES (HSP10)
MGKKIKIIEETVVWKISSPKRAVYMVKKGEAIYFTNYAGNQSFVFNNKASEETLKKWKEVISLLKRGILFYEKTIQKSKARNEK